MPTLVCAWCIVSQVVFAVGEIALVSPRMVGWQIEIANDTQQLEPGIIKRVDADINCALVAFESGKKEWLDLTLSVFKVLVQHAERDGNQDQFENGDRRMTEASDEEALITTKQVNSEFAASGSSTTESAYIADELDRYSQPQPEVPPLNVPTRTVDSDAGLASNPEAVQFASKPPPESDVTSFDWYSEGGHVEICDLSGNFIEGAILCSKTETHVHLYNETRQFFEISMKSQSFKVMIHGLLSLKWIPMGQALEVYSAMTGGFHQGIVIKAAEVGKLTPVRFSSGAVEWLDLSTQTFKLVFLNSGQQQRTDEEVSSPTKSASSLTHKAHHHHRHHHSTAVPLELPSLHIGQRVEIFDASSKQFAKYKVAAGSATTNPHEYQFAPQTVAASIGSGLSRISANLTHLRCRIPLTPHMWNEYRHILAGRRIDVYDRAEKIVVTAKILEVGSRDDDDQQQHAMLVRFKDGKKSWIYAQSVKVKLRLQGEALDLQNGRGNIPEHSESKSIAVDDEGEAVGLSESDADEMWERPIRVDTSPRDNDLSPHQQQTSATKSRLSRHRSDLAALPSVDSVTQAQLSHAASAGDFFAHQRSIEIASMTEMTQKVPSIVQPLDFSSLRKLRSATASSSDEPVYLIASESEAPSIDPSSGSSHSSARSRSSDSSSTRSSRLPFTMTDVWREELDSAMSQVVYVNNGSGTRQTEVPEWLERADEVSGKLFVVHTPSNTLYSVPTTTSSSSTDTSIRMAQVSSSRASSSAPGSAHSSSPLGASAGRVVVPVGPIEAVRVYNMLDK